MPSLGGRPDNCETQTEVRFERSDGSIGQFFVGACDHPENYAQAVRTAVAEARRENGRHIVVNIIDAASREILSAIYARDDRL
jgi:hypothetical protein